MAYVAAEGGDDVADRGGVLAHEAGPARAGRRLRTQIASNLQPLSLLKSAATH